MCLYPLYLLYMQIIPFPMQKKKKKKEVFVYARETVSQQK